MKSIYCYPYISMDNEYINNLQSVWKKLGYIICQAPRDLSETLKCRPGSEDVIVLNWFEERASKSKLPVVEFIRTIIMITLLNLKFSKIITIKHNIKPHNNACTFYYRVLSLLVSYVSDETVVHRDNYSETFSYIPHPIYPKSSNLDKTRKIDFLVFGAVKKYKGIDKLLLNWPAEYSLKIIGKCDSYKIKSTILSIIKIRKLTVEWEDRFISTNELDEAIVDSKFVILPHDNNSMIVSGAFYHAASLGASILMKEGGFSNYCCSKFSFVKSYDDNALESVIETIKPSEPYKIISELKAVCGLNEIMVKWQLLLEGGTNENSGI